MKTIYVHGLENQKRRKRCEMERNEFEKLLKEEPILIKSQQVIKELAKENNSVPFYEEHFVPCAKVCFYLSYEKNVDKVDSILTGLFHDVGKFMLKNGIDNHEIVGAEFAEKFLNQNNYEKNKTIIIKSAIRNHRKNSNDKLDKMSKIIIDADIISYILHRKYFNDYLLKEYSNEEAERIYRNKAKQSYERLDEDGKKVFYNIIANII